MLTKKQVLRMAWDAYNEELLGRNFDDLFDGEVLLHSMVDELGDGLIQFILIELDECLETQGEDAEMKRVALETMGAAYTQVDRVVEAFR